MTGLVIRGDSPQSRISTHSNSSGGALSMTNSSVDTLDESRSIGCSTSLNEGPVVAEMVLKGIPVSTFYFLFSRNCFYQRLFL